MIVRVCSKNKDIVDIDYVKIYPELNSNGYYWISHWDSDENNLNEIWIDLDRYSPIKIDTHGNNILDTIVNKAFKILNRDKKLIELLNEE